MGIYIYIYVFMKILDAPNEIKHLDQTTIPIYLVGLSRDGTPVLL